MKNSLLVAVCLLITSYAVAQQANAETEVEVVKVRSLNKYITGRVNEKLDYTLYVTYYRTSPDHLGVYSVKGWFTLGDSPKKVPLVGIYDGGLTLYSFGDDQTKNDSILNFTSQKAVSHWDLLKEMKSKTNYLQKWELNTAGKDTVRTPNVNLGVKTYTTSIAVVQEREMLQVAPSKAISLTELDVVAKGYTLEGHGETNNGHRVLLSFDYQSRSYVLGRCGAGQEKGYVLLVFDKDWSLVESKIEYIESCERSIGVGATDHRADFMLVYKVDGENGEARKLIVDKNQLKLYIGQWTD